MQLNNTNILKIRTYIKNKILNEPHFVGYKIEREQIYNLIKKTTDSGESNSAIIIGPPGVGKTLLINSILGELEKSNFSTNTLLVRLHGLVHTDDRLALKGITGQMQLDNAVDGKVFGSFAENMSFLLACLKSGQRETTKSILFILEEFELFCAHHNQTLLYNLFDITQSAQTPVCVIGLTCRLDVIELFEKRVKSRFSHRQIFLFPSQPEDSKISDIQQRLNNIQNLLLITNGNHFNSNFREEWNKNIRELIKDKKFQYLVQRLLDINSNERLLKNLLVLVISELNDTHQNITVDDFETQLQMLEKDDLICNINDLNVLEVCLIIAMKYHTEIYDNQPFNFEMILSRYNKFVSTQSNLQMVQRAVVLKTFEHLENLELISSVRTIGGRLLKEYKLYKLSITSEQIMEGVKKFHGLPTEVVQWASSVSMS